MNHDNMRYYFGMAPFDITLILRRMSLIVSSLMYSFACIKTLTHRTAIIIYFLFIFSLLMIPISIILHIVILRKYLITPGKYETNSYRSDEWLEGAVRFKITSKEYNISKFEFPVIYIIYLTYLLSIMDKYGFDKAREKLIQNSSRIAYELYYKDSDNLLKRGYAVLINRDISVNIYLYPDEILDRLIELQDIFDDIKLEVIYGRA